MRYASKVIAVSEAEVGYLEKKSNSNLDSKTANAGYNNYTKYARDLDALGYFYNGAKNGYPYCDVFVDWCFVQAYGVDAALDLLCQPKKSYGAGCDQSAGYYKKKGQFHKTNPKAGDQIFFWNSKKTEAGHTGLVIKVDSTSVYTREGNTSGASGVIANGGGVCDKKYKLNDPDIYGYGRPNYDTEQEEAPKEEPKEEPKAEPTKTITQVAREVLNGKWSNGADRKKRLIEAGYDYNAVQKEVNRLYNSSKIALKSNEAIAKEVIQGKWGTGATRKKKLTEAGYDYNTIQALVNKMLK